MYKLLSKFIIMILFMNFSFVCAEIESPINVLKNINKNILIIVDKNIGLEDVKLNELLGNYIIPYIDFNEMCLWIFGKNIWKSMPINKQNNFINEFQKLVIKTYSTTLNRYIKSNIIFFDNKNVDTKNMKYERKVQVSSEIENSDGGKNLHVDYRLILHKDSWKLYDLIIEGVSILKGFQAQFSNDIKKYGIDFVIDKIKKHNN